MAYYGGNVPLKPERARSWTATIEAHPRSLPGLRLTASYFNIVYKDRVVMPIGVFDSSLLTLPEYAPFITYHPTPAQLAAVLATPGRAFFNESSNAYNPANVIALVDDNYVNAANQKIHGVDLAGSYDFTMVGGTTTLDGSASWLDAEQTNDPSLPSYPVAGRIFTPAKFRARGGVSWDNQTVAIATFVNYVGSVQDVRYTPYVQGGDFVTVDATIRYRTAPGHDPLSGVEIAVAIQNLFNQAPPLSQPQANYQLSYDSTNYSGVGRFVSFSVTKHW